MISILTDDEAVDLYKELCELWGKVGMKASKWLSNSTKVLETIPPQSRASQMNLGNGECELSTASYRMLLQMYLPSILLKSLFQQ